MNGSRGTGRLNVGTVLKAFGGPALSQRVFLDDALCDPLKSIVVTFIEHGRDLVLRLPVLYALQRLVLAPAHRASFSHRPLSMKAKS